MSDTLYSVMAPRLRMLSPTDAALDFTNFKRLWQKVKRIWIEGGYEDFRFHDLKHTYGSHTVRASADMITHKAVTRHKSLKMMERYSHFFPERVRKAVLSLDTVLAVKPDVLKAIGAEAVGVKAVAVVSDKVVGVAIESVNDLQGR